MKTVKNMWSGLSMIVALALVITVGMACEQAADEGVDEPETRGTLYLVDQDWNGQLATTAVAQILLEQEMDHTVATKFAPARFGAPLHRPRTGRFPFSSAATGLPTAPTSWVNT